MSVKDSQGEPMSVTETAQKEVRRTVGNLTGLLAIVGAGAALVQIWEAINRSEPDVTAESHYSASFIPDGSRVALSIDERSIWSFSKNDNIKHYCNRYNTDGKINYFRDDDNCVKITSVVRKMDKSVEFADKSVTRNVLDVKNSGSDAAIGLKIRLPDDGHILVADQAGKSVLDKDVSSGDALALPILNPSESIKVTVDTAVSNFDTAPIRPLPILTYSRGPVSISRYRVVSPFFGSLADALDGIPTFILLLLFVVVSFVVTVSVILIAAVANALIKGRAISSAFQNNAN